MPNAGSQIVLCDLPVRFDTYEGCTHGCTYCFARRKGGAMARAPKNAESVKVLEAWIRGERHADTNWCDWDIHLHWGGVSDPFQPCEKDRRRSYAALKVFAKHGYPFVFSTKGALVVDADYLQLLKDCDCVAQVSMVAPSFDTREPGAPTYAARLKIVEALAKVCRRVVVRCQPYMPAARHSVLLSLPNLRNAGAFGLILEGMKRSAAGPGFEKWMGDYVLPLQLLKNQFIEIRRECRARGLTFLCGENRLRSMSDMRCCCGAEGLGWRLHTANLNHVAGGEIEFTPRMHEPGTGYGMVKSMDQSSAASVAGRGMSYVDAMKAVRSSRLGKAVG